MTSVEKTAKTVDEAIALALAELKIALEQADVTVLDEPTKGLFGFLGGKPARVKVVRKRSPEEVALVFLEQLIDKMGASNVACAVSKETDEGVHIDVVGGISGLLIGKRGQTLDAIQQLTALIYSRSGGTRRLMVDVNSYRAKRIESLEEMSLKLAEKAKRTGRRVILEPMGAFERRVIHMALQQDREIVTYSEGDEPYRKVIIALR